MNCKVLDSVLQQAVDAQALVGASYAVILEGKVIARHWVGHADREAGVLLRSDHLFRAFSNTKLVTSIAALQLHEQGLFDFDDPVGDYLPALQELRVLKPGAVSLDDTEPAREPVRIRHLLTHTAGFTYGFLDPTAPIAKAYAQAGMADPTVSLEEQIARLAHLPLLFQPGTRWNYSVATDVVGRLVEVLSGSALDRYFERHVFRPAGMTDTGFTVPTQHATRLAALYVGDLATPLKPGLARADRLMHPGAYLVPQARLNPGGGLVTSLDDYTRLLQILLRGGAPLLQPESMRLVEQNQLPDGMWIQFPGSPMIKGRGHSFVSSVTVDSFEGEPNSRPGDLQWGGLAGTHWFYSPRERLGAVLMTQRYMGFGLPFWSEFKQAVRASGQRV
ncbi:serine hydrolase domain-containing protein [Variovorax sp. J22P168]|uniref:serine hydrolase domain-containing protein n=1 Tax=Variovorax jilinensis TaxID=3053513 RepID=UPI002578FEA5|nr:serine hydrolase domain-containing protein [Variovorax sp. J22P168]MDM0015254.1 serine hydrolase domain-containing protein [Variovorax sp. J22P168]